MHVLPGSRRVSFVVSAESKTPPAEERIAGEAEEKAAVVPSTCDNSRRPSRRTSTIPSQRSTSVRPSSGTVTGFPGRSTRPACWDGVGGVGR